MKKGFGIFNVRITGIAIIATLACILAVLNPAIGSASIGILGAIMATYLAAEQRSIVCGICGGAE